LTRRPKRSVRCLLAKVAILANKRAKLQNLALADSSAVKLSSALKLRSSIPSAVADFASACIYLCSKNCLVLIFMFVLSLKKNYKNCNKVESIKHIRIILNRSISPLNLAKNQFGFCTNVSE